MSDPLLTSGDVAARLQVNIRTAQRIMRSIPHINIGTGKKNEHLRVSEEMLQRYIEDRIVVPCFPQIRSKSPTTARRIPETGGGKIARRR